MNDLYGEVVKTDDIYVGGIDDFAVYYPEDGFLVGGYTRETAQDVLNSLKFHRVPSSEGAYIVKYSIERVED